MRNTIQLSILIFAILSFFISCSPDLEENISTEHTKQEFTGREVFKSLFFADGQLTKEIPVLANSYDFKSFLSDEELIAYRDNQNKILDHIDANNSTFFESFQTEMYSGDFNRIKSAILEGSTIFYSSILEASNVEKIDLENSELYAENNGIGKITKFDAEGRKIIDLALEQNYKLENPDDTFFFTVGIAVVAVSVVANVSVVINVAVAANAVAIANATFTENVNVSPPDPPEEDSRSAKNMILDEVSISLMETLVR